MNDFNRGALPVPCLRLDHGFGEHWESVELGDGTGYVRLVEYEKLESENAMLRELVFDMLVDEERGHNDDNTFDEHVRAAKELGVEVDG